MDKSEFLKWTVEIEVHRSWITDGFDMDDDRALDMLAHTLPYANIGQELRARVTKRPSAAKIVEAQNDGD